MRLMRLAFGAGLLLCACGSNRSGQMPVPDQSVTAQLKALRVATRPFHDLKAAVAAGYPEVVKDCIVHEHHGAMGYHHLNRSFIEHDISVQRPQFLLYERMPGGEYRLNGVEFIIPYRLWPRDSVAPMFMGQHMKPEDTFKYWYLHVWAWRDNPDGMFADFHPQVQCADSARRVYHPNPA